MRAILLCLLTVSGLFTHAQTYTFTQAEYLFGSQDSAGPAFSRALSGTFTVRIDTVKKTLSYPQLQVIEALSTRRNIWLGATLANQKDTTLITTTNVSTLKMVPPYTMPANILKDFQSKGDTMVGFVYLEGSVTASLFKTYTNLGGQAAGPVPRLYLAVQYPPWTIPNVGRYYRLIWFRQ